ncbi:hypothetical protein ACFVWR_08890 [Leifsonia sp. NPDC058292]|uniref:hypothetical protein n=1 Tax=Leifsonia sp. NPDC058292 TaxID=3346428 RepID=UPI0036DC6004
MRSRTDPAASDPRFGVGVQVHVLEPAVAGDDDWVGEPTGVIIAPASASLRAVNLPSGSSTRWMVSFDQPQHRRDGRGPFESASIEQHLLVAAEPIAD